MDVLTHDELARLTPPERLALISQLWDIVITLVWSGGVALVILLLLKYTIGIRSSESDEEEGLDLADHGEKAYNY